MPDNFLWGATTAAYTIEGALRENGRGESIWDRFAAMPGRIRDNSSAEPAADHYHRTRDDVALMAELGLRAYRFSIAWPRIQPEGRGRPNQAGLDFYERLVEALLQHSIRPFATLYHWDLPQGIQERGGWAGPDTVARFAEYADIVSYRLGDHVHDWITIAAPRTVAYQGHVTAEHAPGQRVASQYTRIAHHLLMAHGTAVPVLRDNARDGFARVGISLDLKPIEPATPHDEDERAAILHDGAVNRWYLDALVKGIYPQDMLERQPLEVESRDMSVIATPLDFLGIDYGQPVAVTMGPRDEPREQTMEAGGAREEQHAGLYTLLKRVHDDYKPSTLYVTADGVADTNDPGGDGTVRDTERVAYLRMQHEEIVRARHDGIAVRGYFVRDLLDGWEWTEGYTKRRGLIHVDRATQRRTIKDSGRWYMRLIAGEEERL